MFVCFFRSLFHITIKTRSRLKIRIGSHQVSLSRVLSRPVHPLQIQVYLHTVLPYMTGLFCHVLQFYRLTYASHFFYSFSLQILPVILHNADHNPDHQHQPQTQTLHQQPNWTDFPLQPQLQLHQPQPTSQQTKWTPFQLPLDFSLPSIQHYHPSLPHQDPCW